MELEIMKMVFAAFVAFGALYLSIKAKPQKHHK